MPRQPSFAEGVRRGDDVRDELQAGQRRDDCRRLAVDETVILLHPPLRLVGVSTVMEREHQQNDSLVNGYRRRKRVGPHVEDRADDELAQQPLQRNQRDDQPCLICLHVISLGARHLFGCTQQLLERRRDHGGTAKGRRRKGSWKVKERQ